MNEMETGAKEAAIGTLTALGLLYEGWFGAAGARTKVATTGAGVVKTRYIVYAADTAEGFQFASESIYATSTIAKGNRIKDVSRLVSEYGGVASDWKKVTGFVKAKSIRTGIYEKVEVHWYSLRGQAFEYKLKVR